MVTEGDRPIWRRAAREAAGIVVAMHHAFELPVPLVPVDAKEHAVVEEPRTVALVEPAAATVLRRPEKPAVWLTVGGEPHDPLGLIGGVGHPDPPLHVHRCLHRLVEPRGVPRTGGGAARADRAGRRAGGIEDLDRAGGHVGHEQSALLVYGQAGRPLQMALRHHDSRRLVALKRHPHHPAVRDRKQPALGIEGERTGPGQGDVADDSGLSRVVFDRRHFKHRDPFGHRHGEPLGVSTGRGPGYDACESGLEVYSLCDPNPNGPRGHHVAEIDMPARGHLGEIPVEIRLGPQRADRLPAVRGID